MRLALGVVPGALTQGGYTVFDTHLPRRRSAFAQRCRFLLAQPFYFLAIVLEIVAELIEGDPC